jgi:hypothetical protein
MTLRLPNALYVRFHRLAAASPALLRELKPARQRRRRTYGKRSRKRTRSTS